MHTAFPCNCMEQGHCGGCRRKWRLTNTDLCPCGEIQTMSPDKTEWRLISATLCGWRWRGCFVADQLWFMTRIREEVMFLHYLTLHITLCKCLAGRQWIRPSNSGQLDNYKELWTLSAVTRVTVITLITSRAPQCTGMQPFSNLS